MNIQLLNGWENVNQLLSGFGNVFLELFITLAIYILFVFMVPESYRALLKWAATLSVVTYVSQWLVTK